MKKRSKDRQRVQLQDPLSWVLAGLKPLTTAKSELLQLQNLNHGALVAVSRGVATIDDADALLGAFNMAEALARLGVGTDWLPEIAEAQAALRSAGSRSKFMFTGPELCAVNLAMDVHDVQIRDPGTTIGLIEKALAMVKKDIVLKRAKPLMFPQPA